MDMKCFDNYIYTRMLDLDLQQQKRNAYEMYNVIINNFTKTAEVVTTETTDVFDQYNYLMYPLNGMPSLYEKIKETFRYAMLEDNYGIPLFEEYNIQCWLNVYHKGKFINWHGHWPKHYYAWHGFYCVDVEPDSATHYRIKDKQETIIESKNNLIVISKSGDDVHKSTKWEYDYPRITVAFDIVPTQILYKNTHHIKTINHWIPV